MRRTHEPGTKARISFSGGPHAPVNMANSMEEVNVGGNKNPQEMTRLLRCTALHFVSQVFANPWSSSGLPSPLDPETVQLLAFSILSAMFTGVCGPLEKLGLALVPRSNVLRMTVQLAYTFGFSDCMSPFAGLLIQLTSQLCGRLFVYLEVFPPFPGVHLLYHVIKVCLLSQSASEKHNQEKKAHKPLRTSWISQKCVLHVW